MLPEPIAYTRLADGTLRPIYEEIVHGFKVRQYLLDDDGDPVFGIWFIPQDYADCDKPIIVDRRPF